MWRAINPPTPPPTEQMFWVWGATSCAEANKDCFFMSDLHLGDISAVTASSEGVFSVKWGLSSLKHEKKNAVC